MRPSAERDQLPACHRLTALLLRIQPLLASLAHTAVAMPLLLLLQALVLALDLRTCNSGGKVGHSLTAGHVTRS